MVFLVFASFVVCPIMSIFLASEVSRSNGDLGTLFFAIFMPFTGIICFYSLIWQHSGEEIITIKPDRIKIRKKIYGSGNEYVIEPIEIDTLELSGRDILKAGSKIMFWGLPWHKAIRVKSNGKYKYFGNDLNVAEAQEVIEYIKENTKRVNRVTNENDYLK